MSSKKPWALVLWLAASGCGSGGDAPAIETPPSTAAPASEGTAEEPVAPPATAAVDEPVPATTRPSALDTETACERARTCCPLFVDAIGDPVEAERARIACEQMEHLSELGEASGEACLAALDGWRRALELAEREVPLSCR
jgi:hypothetical protein